MVLDVKEAQGISSEVKMQDKIKNLIKKSLKNLEVEEVDFVIEHPEYLKNGDYSTNAAIVCAKKLKTNPKEFAGKIIKEMSKMPFDMIEKVETAGAGFINFYLSRDFFSGSVKEIKENKNFGKNKILAGQKIMIEYTDPNPFKPFHIGHLMTNAIGESVARIIEHSGAKVIRANYQGDVGLHVAKAIWGLMNNSHLAQDDNIPLKLKAANIGAAYALGSEQYEKNRNSREEIDEINKKVYDRSDQMINKIYDWGFKVTMEAFEDLYRMLGTKFDLYFLESQMAPIGEKIVRENLGKAFSESQGAIVFKGEEHDPRLHTRVFITSQGLPTYETKELGLTFEKFKTEPNMNMSIVITATEQADYMRVVAKAISLINLGFAGRMRHITHGMMRFASGKMSSRKGNVITSESLMNDVRLLVIEKITDRNLSENEMNKISEEVAVAALKYSVLKQSIGGDIMYDFEKSISFEGDSGPYLQYSYARARSVSEKAKKENILAGFKNAPGEITEMEKLLYRFPEAVQRAAAEFAPQIIASYLIELARSFNSFYGSTQIIDKNDKESPYKVALTEAFSVVMKNGLYLLGISAPARM